jgi:hypothetical protein
MSKSLDDYIKKLPPYIGKEIFKFIIYDWHNIIFYHKLNYYNYSLKYTIASINHKLIENRNGTYLSRIAKENGKHRYYLTNEFQIVYCGGCGEEITRHNRHHGCRGGLDYEYYYKNKYVGKDLDNALLELYLQDK